MNVIPLNIADILMQGGIGNTSQGLFNGNAGLCVFFYHLARNTKCTKYEEFADNLLDQVFANLSTFSRNDFENGLAGIGWVTEYLVQNGFAEGDTDEILGEIDTKIFIELNAESISSFELNDGLTGYLFYLIFRLRKPTFPNSVAQQINRELFILIINKLDEVVTNQFPSITKEVYFDLFWRFPVVLYGLLRAFDLDIYNEKIKCMINQWSINLETHLPSMNINRIYLATILVQINIRLQNKLEKQIQTLLFATDFEAIETEVDSTSVSIRYGWPGIVWLLQQASEIIPSTYPNYQKIISTRLEMIAKYRPILESYVTTNTKQYGLTQGLSGIALMELLWPGIYC